MQKSSFGKSVRIRMWGGSHEPFMYLEIIGLPVDYPIQKSELLDILKDRAPKNNKFETSRTETDIPLIFDETTKEYMALDHIFFTTDVMKFRVENKNFRSSDYNLELPRPNHCDLPAYDKYGHNINLNGGGPFSARMTVLTCIAGSISSQILKKAYGIEIDAFVHSVGNIYGDKINTLNPTSHQIPAQTYKLIDNAKGEKTSLGGYLYGFATGLPVGIGGYIFDGIDSYLSHLIFSIPAVKSVEFGDTKLMGHENTDEIISYEKSKYSKITTKTNNSGGIQGGLSNSMPLIAKVLFKPPASIGRIQNTYNLSTNKIEEFTIKGRHDACFLFRAVPVLKSVLALGILDGLVELNYFKGYLDDNLKDMRSQISSIDTQIIELLEKRMNLSKKIGKLKSTEKIEILDNNRENLILSRVPIKYHNIFKEIMKLSKNLQKGDKTI